MVTGSAFVAITIDGLAFGVFLALLGVSITLVFGLGEILNLAVGTFAVIAVLVATVFVGRGVSILIAASGGIAAVALLGMILDRILLPFVYRKTGEDRILLGIFVTLGLAVFLEGTLVNYFRSRYTLPLGLESITYGELSVTVGSVVVVVIGVAVLAVLYLLLNSTYLGLATKTVIQDETGAQLVGVDPRRVQLLIFVASSIIAGVAGILYAFSFTLTVGTGFEFTIFAVIVSIVGGVRNYLGAIVAGILLGLINQYASFFVGSYIATVILFSAAILFLLAKPEAFS